MAEMTLAFETESLRVFEVGVTPLETVGRRVVFMAFLRGGGASHAVGHATVCYKTDVPAYPFDFYCEWLEVAPPFQRKGYAKELFLGIEQNKLSGRRMAAVAASPEGEAFLAHLGRPKDSLATVIEQFQQFFALPAVEERLRQEQDALANAPPDENPVHSAFRGNALAQLMKLAPLTALKATATNTALPPCDRIRALGQLATIFNGEG